MKVLLLISEMWNDIEHPNNNLTNWFLGAKGFDIATITGGAGAPHNSCCKHYFQITDYSMARSFFGRKAGKIIHLDDLLMPDGLGACKVEENIYARRSSMHKPIYRLIRDFIWRFGRYDTELLKAFIDEFKPDIIFSQRMGSVKMCRMEKIVSKIAAVPIVAYTGDNEYSQDGLTGTFLEKMHILWTRKWLDTMIPKYKLYYSMSYAQMKFYEEKFGVQTRFLVKSGDFKDDRVHKSINTPIKLLYAGKLYCGRGDTLAVIAEAIRKINAHEKSVQLDIYTNDTVTEHINELLNDGENSIIHEPVSGDKVKELYKLSDIVLHVEGFDEKNAVLTKYSFSTKIMDCLASGCAVMAVCFEEQAGFDYLRRNDIAITSDLEHISETLNNLIDNPDIILSYALRAFLFGREHHQREIVQKQMYDDFRSVISENA